MFDKVYDKLMQTIEDKVKYMYTIRPIGGLLDYHTIKILNVYINYLTRIKESQYRYNYIDGLTGISNYLNKI